MTALDGCFNTAKKTMTALDGCFSTFDLGAEWYKKVYEKWKERRQKRAKPT